jgi:peptidoglycan/LPS O-acetylase OafA/YrhL
VKYSLIAWKSSSLFTSAHSTWLDYGELNAQSKGLLTQTFFLVTRMGKEAVMVFFVMSGYLVGGGGD